MVLSLCLLPPSPHLCRDLHDGAPCGLNLGAGRPRELRRVDRQRHRQLAVPQDLQRNSNISPAGPVADSPRPARPAQRQQQQLYVLPRTACLLAMTPPPVPAHTTVMEPDAPTPYTPKAKKGQADAQPGLSLPPPPPPQSTNILLMQIFPETRGGARLEGHIALAAGQVEQVALAQQLEGDLLPGSELAARAQLPQIDRHKFLHARAHACSGAAAPGQRVLREMLSVMGPPVSHSSLTPHQVFLVIASGTAWLLQATTMQPACRRWPPEWDMHGRAGRMPHRLRCRAAWASAGRWASGPPQTLAGCLRPSPTGTSAHACQTRSCLPACAQGDTQHTADTSPISGPPPHAPGL